MVYDQLIEFLFTVDLYIYFLIAFVDFHLLYKIKISLKVTHAIDINHECFGSIFILNF